MVMVSSGFSIPEASNFHWLILPVWLLVLYQYGEQIAQRRWRVVLGALAFWLMDWVNEIGNGLIAHFSGSAPLWGLAQGHTTGRLLIGLNVEISLMFAVMGLLAVRVLPRSRALCVLGVNNRLWLAAVNSTLCVLTEVGLNRIGMLGWAWPCWGRQSLWPILLFGYAPFFLIAYWVHDMRSMANQRRVVAGLAVVVGLSLILFGDIGWLG